MVCRVAQSSLLSACMFQRTRVVTTCQLLESSTYAAVVACCLLGPSGKLGLSLSTWVVDVGMPVAAVNSGCNTRHHD
jgi:hypothetical protein